MPLSLRVLVSALERTSKRSRAVGCSGQHLYGSYTNWPLSPQPTSKRASMSVREGTALIRTDTAEMLVPTSHLLLIDGDPNIRRSLASFFEAHNMPVHAVPDWRTSRQDFEASNLSLIVLDLPLGGDDRLRPLREIRSRSDLPIIVTADHQCDESDRVIALEMGADDHLAKPFSMRELLARVRAVLRRRKLGKMARARDPERGGFRFGGWQLHRRARHLAGPKGNTVPLTKGEYALLLAFLETPQRPLSRERLLQATRVLEDVFDRSIDVQVMRLRRKLEQDPGSPQIIRTERGVGYVFVPTVDPF